MTFIKGQKGYWFGKKKPGIGGVKKGNIPWNKGKKLSEEHIKNLIKSHLGIKMPPRTEKHRMNIALSRNGKKSHLWKGGVSKKNKKIRAGIKFRLWREAVFKRDNWTCQECGKRGFELHPHHIKPFSLYPELRFVVANGKTLCKECHKKTDNYAKRFDLNKKYDNIGHQCGNKNFV